MLVPAGRPLADGARLREGGLSRPEQHPRRCKRELPCPDQKAAGQSRALFAVNEVGQTDTLAQALSPFNAAH